MTENTSHDDLLQATRSLERKLMGSMADIRSDLRSNTEAVQRLSGSLDENWKTTRAQGVEIVRLSTLHEANSEKRAAAVKADIERHDPANEGIIIPTKAVRLAALVMTAVVMFAGIIGALIGAPGVP